MKQSRCEKRREDSRIERPIQRERARKIWRFAGCDFSQRYMYISRGQRNYLCNVAKENMAERGAQIKASRYARLIKFQRYAGVA